MVEPYFMYEGAQNLAEKLSGAENVYLGIRPYGFHAGNKIPFVVYPYILCSEMRKRGKEPNFTFYVFINDWEQDAIDTDVVNIGVYPFNVIPKFSTLQFTKGTGGGNIVDEWEPTIVDNVLMLKDYYPSVKIRCVRNSSMRDNRVMKEVVLKTIESPDLVGSCLKHSTGKPLLEAPYAYCRPVCPRCKSARTESEVVKHEDIHIVCDNCGADRLYSYHLLYYWLYHKPLALPRISEFNINLCITGSDHYNEGDFKSRIDLFNAYGIPVSMPDTLYAPTLYGKNGSPMGKSKGNAADVDFSKLYEMVMDQRNASKIMM